MAPFSLLVVLAAVTRLSVADIIVSNSCSAYEQLEDVASCGKDGYLIKYGLRNCKKFSSPETRSQFSAVGVQFLECTKKCLIAHLRDLFLKQVPTCSTIHDSAFESHVSCYLKCDFCKVCKTEKLALMNSYDKSDFLSLDAAAAVFKVMKACGPLSCFFSFF